MTEAIKKSKREGSDMLSEPSFYKWQLKEESSVFHPDVLDALLEDEKLYTLVEVNEIIQTFMMGEVC
ncbi:hypothetical protein NQ117_10215 [Paenibacillus sp. SC116]|uniref:hypothetical protein n=1 Tax=Paenibacillus sp. SC116 TaxID=2968986 RepID=UPI00215B0D6D|nr:hypothetical protein [Paenibacillus sp. SC116]MCR8844059.1 hypothetical protein [Paenibacillus sp. SC116]